MWAALKSKLLWYLGFLAAGFLLALGLLRRPARRPVVVEDTKPQAKVVAAEKKAAEDVKPEPVPDDMLEVIDALERRKLLIK